jgi:hypothetical protein
MSKKELNDCVWNNNILWFNFKSCGNENIKEIKVVNNHVPVSIFLTNFCIYFPSNHKPFVNFQICLQTITFNQL